MHVPQKSADSRNTCIYLTMLIVTVIVSYKFLQRQKMAKSRELDLARNQNKIDDQRLKIHRVRQAGSHTAMVDGVWNELGREVWGRG